MASWHILVSSYVLCFICVTKSHTSQQEGLADGTESYLKQALTAIAPWHRSPTSVCCRRTLLGCPFAEWSRARIRKENCDPSAWGWRVMPSFSPRDTSSRSSIVVIWLQLPVAALSATRVGIRGFCRCQGVTEVIMSRGCSWLIAK